MSAKRFRDRRNEGILAGLDKGFAVSEVARIAGVSKETVRQVCRDAGRPLGKPTVKLIGTPAERAERAADLRRQGLLYKQIAHEMGVTTQTVGNMLGRFGMTRGTRDVR